MPTKKKDLIYTNLENRVPQSQRYSLVPHVLECAFQSDCTAYLFEHLSHFHFFSPCFLQKCFLIPVRSPSALAGLWCTQLFSGQTYTRFLGSLLLLCRSFHGRLCPLLCSCRFWSLWNPLPHISHKKRFVARRVFGESAITSASGSVDFDHHALNQWENYMDSRKKERRSWYVYMYTCLEYQGDFFSS